MSLVLSVLGVLLLVSYLLHPGSLGRMYLPLSRFGRYPYYSFFISIFSFSSSPLLRSIYHSVQSPVSSSPLAYYIFISASSLHSIIGASATKHLSLHLLQVCLTSTTSSAPSSLPTQLKEDQGSCWPWQILSGYCTRHNYCWDHSCISHRHRKSKLSLLLLLLSQSRLSITR